MLKAFATEGRRICLFNSRNLKSFYGFYGSRAGYSKIPNSNQNPTEEEVTKASTVPTMFKPRNIPKKSFNDMVELLKKLKELDNFKLRLMTSKSKQKSIKSLNKSRKLNPTSQTGSSLESKTGLGSKSEAFLTGSEISTETGLSSESKLNSQTASSSESNLSSSETSLGSDTNISTSTGLDTESTTSSQTNSGTESETSSQTGLGTESTTSSQTSSGTESETSSQTGLGSESTTSSQTSLGTESETSSQTGLGSESNIFTQTASESDSLTQTNLGLESEEILKIELVPENPGTELERIETTTDLDIPERVPKKIFPKVFSFASLVNENECLQKLVALQVDLSAVQKKKGIAKYLIACNFEKHVAPYVLFLTRLEVEDIGRFLTKNIEIVQTDLTELENRVNYLKSKDFSSKDVCRIVSNSSFLLMDSETVDDKLGHLQKLFSLSGKEVREVLIKTPKLLNKPHMLQVIKDNKLHCKEFLGFSHMELKNILLNYPGFFMKSPGQLSKMFDYLHNTMEIDHKTLVKNCHVFKTRLRFIQNRHLYLQKVNRAQYNPQKENFVSFSALVSGTNEEFCANVAKTSLNDYYKFLECL